MEDNPFPAVMGRVCYHPCETACNRGQLDEAVGINSVERFLGDEGIERGWTVEAPAERSGKRVLVVGAGPSGLSAAYHLTRLGHAVTIHDAGPMVGGMMRFGIPKYRLPREVLDAEMQRIIDMGVTLHLGTKVHDLAQTMRAGGYDAAFLAVGAHIAKRTAIPAAESAKILDAVAVLRSMEGEDKPMLGRRVVVYGGGNIGLMGLVADACLQAGGEVTGVIPEALMKKEVGHLDLTQLEVVDSMHTRKARMAELSDGFIALPGGFGTFEELCEVLTWGQLGFHEKPVGLVNVVNYFGPLIELCDRAVDEGFMRTEHRGLLQDADTPEAVLVAMASHTPVKLEKWIRELKQL